jgi:hypothetical protein
MPRCNNKAERNCEIKHGRYLSVRPSAAENLGFVRKNLGPFAQKIADPVILQCRKKGPFPDRPGPHCLKIRRLEPQQLKAVTGWL